MKAKGQCHESLIVIRTHPVLVRVVLPKKNAFRLGIQLASIKDSLSPLV